MEASAVNSPRVSARAATTTPKNVAPPWTQIVRGGSGESDEILSSVATIKSPEKVIPSPTPPSEEECSVVTVQGSESDINNVSKKPAWNKPSNGGSTAAAAVDVGPPVMGGESSWPALSEATKFPQKASSPDFVKNTVSDGSSIPVLQMSGTISSQKQVNSNTNSNQNHAYPRQKSMKRQSGHTSSANGALSQPAPLPAGAVVESPNLNSPNAQKNSNWESGTKGVPGQPSHSDHPQPRNSYRRGSGGPHPRGDASYNHGHGGRRDDRVNRDWLSQQRIFNGREARVQPSGPGSRPFIRTPPPPPPPPPPHGTAQFMVHTPMRPFVPGYPEFPMIPYYLSIPSPDSVRGPFSVVMPSQMYVPVPDHQLHVKLVTQIDYYFSNDNLIKDTFLRANMDDQGWVPITLIAGFKRVKNLTENISLILSAVQSSSVVEVQGDKVRKRNDWIRWVMQHSPQVPSNSGSQDPGMSGNDVMAAHFQSVTLENSEDQTGVSFQGDAQSEVILRRSPSGESNNQTQPSGLDGVAQINVQSGYDASVSARSSSNIDSC